MQANPRRDTLSSRILLIAVPRWIQCKLATLRESDPIGWGAHRRNAGRGNCGMNALELSSRIGRVGLRARVVILVLLAVAPLFGLLVSGAIADREVALANARARAVELARFGAERQADMLQQGRELLIVMRRMPEIIGDDPEACRAAAREIAADHPQFLTIGVVDPEGVIRCHSTITNRQAFRDVAVHRRAMAPDAPRFIVGQFLISAVTGKPVVVMA